MPLLQFHNKLGFPAPSWRHSSWEHHDVLLYSLWWWKPYKGAEHFETHECSNDSLLHIYATPKEVSTSRCAADIQRATAYSAD